MLEDDILTRDSPSPPRKNRVLAQEFEAIRGKTIDGSTSKFPHPGSKTPTREKSQVHHSQQQDVEEKLSADYMTRKIDTVSTRLD